MGIPHYFKNIATQYANVITLPKTSCNRLYLDFNCIVHQCAMNNTTHDAIIQASVEYIIRLCSICNPTDLLYIAVDGVCPRAKMQQQRKRRYMSLWQKEFLGESSEWDSNIVTPGTAFMDKLDRALIKYAIGNTRCKVICSPSTEMGEGEHKIFQHLRTETSMNCSTDVVVYGLDADLILLGLLSQAHHENITINLLRETPEFRLKNTSRKSSEYCCLDIGKLMHGIDETFCRSDVNFPIAEKINELVMLTTFVGNDFLPPLSCLKIKNGGLDMLYRVYEFTRQNRESSRLVLPDKTINWLFLDEFMKNLQKNEDAYFKEANQAYYSRKPFNSNFVTKNSKQYQLDNYTITHMFPMSINPSRPGWWKDYNNVLFPRNSDVVNTSCQKYVDGLEWNVEYYFKGINAPSSNWFYPYSYSPTMKDVSDFISVRVCNQDYRSFAFVPKIYSSTMQLLIVLPPAGVVKYLSKYSRLVTDPAFDCMDMYPSKFRIMTYLKNQIWECIPVLPEVDEERLENGIDLIDST